ncbi:DUF2442 domain-containing protein [Leptothoe spongobia]|uniref:DUF2442 domain-containing protein n=1 Tax=Leptothoe spongobia TAU-MAC 1115 TaxID=1967444 RepID=A0A947DGW4_9CYAN|nr:DUF2442 domain-containing protein [Leptothoe spongobia]MBT9316832.1 DUF2442 domain-containing protein [Leptothoe spongobia TAU-MAC 1115]
MKSMDSIINNTEIQAAEAAGQESLEHEHRAVSAIYDSDKRKLHIISSLDAELILSVDKLQGLAGSSDDDLSDIELSPFGSNLHWPRLDADLGVHSLFCGVYGSKDWMKRLIANCCQAN